MSDTTDLLDSRSGDATSQELTAGTRTGSTSARGATAAADSAPPAASGSAPSTPRRAGAGGGLGSLVLPELQAIASGLGITGLGRLRKGQLIAAIQTAQSGGAANGANGATAPASAPNGRASTGERPSATAASAPEAASGLPAAEQTPDGQSQGRARRRASRPAGSPERADGARDSEPAGDVRSADDVRSSGDVRSVSETRATGDAGQPGHAAAGSVSGDSGGRAATGRSGSTTAEPADSAPTARSGGERTAGEQRTGEPRGERPGGEQRSGEPRETARDGERRDRGRRDGAERGERPRQGGNQQGGNQQGGNQGQSGDASDAGESRDRPRTGGNANRRDFDDEAGGKRGRFRERRNRRGRNTPAGFPGGDVDPVVREDDVLQPVAGILDVLDNYAFVRTSGYLPGPNDVYVSLNLVRRHGLRRGDAVTGMVRVQTEVGDRRDKFNALVRLDTVNGTDPEESRKRPEFTKLTPLYPQERLRLETDQLNLTGRMIDLIAPIGKGQRGLIVSPPKAGKTSVLQSLANSITRNNPECHLMVVLVDERPEEVTDMQRSVKGEVIASTFDRPPADHTMVAELAIERAKRLVELGHDVVVLLDSITRLGRAYNLAAPASGRILSGGVDSTALYPPKRFLGAARNIENGGSLTILATALVETGSMMDTVIFEEFKGTGNMELKLDRRIADKRVFPAIDVPASGTRKEELLLAPDEMRVILQLRRVLHALDQQQALDLLLDRMKQTKTNIEFLMQVAKTSPSVD